jgi:uncharacterized membrane protein YgaE (UPF0421/DUF939 family)
VSDWVAGALQPKVSQRRERLAASAKPIVLSALAASVAWLVARDVLGHAAPYFAPVAALVVIGLTVGQRLRRASELAIGQAVGILAADALVAAIGTGAAQIGLVIGLAMTLAVLVDRGPLLTQQAAVSAALVATIQPPASGLAAGRFVDALVGGATALLVGLVLPTDPLALVRREARPLLEEVAGTLDAIAAALTSRDREAAATALERARALDQRTTHLREALEASREALRYAPTRRSARVPVAMHAIAAGQLDLAVRNVRVLARRALRAVERADEIPEPLPVAARGLANAARELDRQLAQGRSDGSVQERALAAAGLATACLDDSPSLSVTVLVAQVRSTALDVMQAAGMEMTDALQALEHIEPAGPRR